MFDSIKNILALFFTKKNILFEKGITCFGAIPLSECEIKREYLLKRSGLDTHTATVVMLTCSTVHS